MCFLEKKPHKTKQKHRFHGNFHFYKMKMFMDIENQNVFSFSFLFFPSFSPHLPKKRQWDGYSNFCGFQFCLTCPANLPFPAQLFHHLKIISTPHQFNCIFMTTLKGQSVNTSVNDHFYAAMKMITFCSRQCNSEKPKDCHE